MPSLLRRSNWPPLFLAVLLLHVSTAPIRAVIVYGTNGTGTNNTSAPGDNPGWANVGIVNPPNPASGIYLGDYNGQYWMLTANHVTLGTQVTLNGNSYNIVGGSAQQVAIGVDLKVFRIAADPNLPTLTLASTNMPLFSIVTMIGYGKGQLNDTLVTWDIDTDTNPDTWTKDPPGDVDADGSATGYEWGTHSMRWGTNVVQGVNIAAGATASLVTIANDLTNTNEAQASLGDSGGAVFYKNDGNWELVGVMFSVRSATNVNDNLTLQLTGFSGQPASTSIFSYLNQDQAGSTTQSAQIATYKNAIETIIIPEPGTFLLVATGWFWLVAGRRKRR